MKHTNNKRILADVASYIRMNMTNRQIHESMASIGRKLGYSNASIHRALVTLEERKLVRMTRPEIRNQPCVIEYIGTAESEVDQLFQRMFRAMEDMQEVAAELQHLFQIGQSEHLSNMR